MSQASVTTHFFYRENQLSALVRPGAHRSLFRAQDMPLAELAPEAGTVQLLAVDLQRSVLAAADAPPEASPD